MLNVLRRDLEFILTVKALAGCRLRTPVPHHGHVETLPPCRRLITHLPTTPTAVWEPDEDSRSWLALQPHLPLLRVMCAGYAVC